MRSLRGRIVNGLLISLIAVFLIQAILVTLAIRQVTENYASSRLEHEIENLVAIVQFDSNGHPQLNDTRINQFYERPFSGHYYLVSTASGTLASRSLWDWRLDSPLLSPGQQQRLHLDGPQSQALLMLVHGFSKQGVHFTVTVAEDFSPVNADIRRFQIGFGGLSILFLLTMAVLAAWTVRKGLRPLQHARTELEALQSGEARTLDERVPREMQPLVQEINRLLLLTQQRLERSRKATGNLAHGLKTPLSTLVRLSEDPALTPHVELRRNLETQVSRMSDLIQRELKVARLAGSGPSGSHFVAAQELPGLIEALERIYEPRGVRIDLQADPAHRFAGDREDMLELFGILLDNACQWARTQVRLVIEPDPGLAATIADDGPGVDESKYDQLLERGARLDEVGNGHGLGLAIAGDIVRQYGGELELARSSLLGGLQVTVRLPPQHARATQN